MRREWFVLIIAVLLAASLSPATSARDAGAPPTDSAASASATLPLWKTLPEVPPLPVAEMSGYARINGARLYYAVFNQGGGDPVILLHGGFGSAEDWGFEVPLLSKTHEVIVVDCRGRGRSTLPPQPLSYKLMASDILGLMNYLKISTASIVGWSDGGIIALLLAIHHADRIDKLFVFGTNFSHSGYKHAKPDPAQVKRYMARVKATYRRLSSTPNGFQKLLDALSRMYTTEPELDAARIATIKAPTVVADGQYEQFITRAHSEALARLIPGAKLVIIPNVSHGGPIQDPMTFHRAVAKLLDGEGQKPH